MSKERRKAILELLRSSSEPITGTELAARLGVSRQVVVQDVALLRAEGIEILATPQGYRLASMAPSPPQAVLACRHERHETREELEILVDCGLKVVDVVVEHPLYGELRGLLMLSSRREVQRFMEQIEKTGAPLLSTLTSGVHLHTVEYPSPEALEQARASLSQKGWLLSI